MIDTINVGMVAKCVKGYTGLITTIRRFSMRLGDMEKPLQGPLYLGICLDLDRAGKPWRSVNPVIIAPDIDEWVEIRARELKQEFELETAAGDVLRSDMNNEN